MLTSATKTKMLPRQIAVCRSGTIAYRESKSTATAMPVICLHGIGGDDTSFVDQMGGPFLEGLGDRRVIAWNMPGYAQSSPMKNMNFANLATMVAELMDTLKIKHAHLVGQSIGGMIAQEVAIQTPDRVAGLSLIATVPAFGGLDETFKTVFLKTRLDPLDAGATMAELAQEAIPEIMGPHASRRSRQMAVDAMASIDPVAYRQVLKCLVTFNRRADQHQLTMPCCLIAGDLDDNSPARVMRKMAEKLPNAEFHIIESAGHLVNSEKPDLVNSVLCDFFDQVKNYSYKVDVAGDK